MCSWLSSRTSLKWKNIRASRSTHLMKPKPSRIAAITPWNKNQRSSGWRCPPQERTNLHLLCVISVRSLKDRVATTPRQRFVLLTISRVSFVISKESERMSMLVALSSLSLRSVEMLNCTWSPSKRVTFDFVSFSPNGISLSLNPIRAVIRPGRGSFCASKRATNDKMCV